MKGITIVAVALLAVGIYLEYNKDSSFASIGPGSIGIGAGVGLLIGSMI
jgi:hypothetical protein